MDSTGGYSTGNTGLLLLTPAHFTHPPQKTGDPFNGHTSNTISSQQHGARELLPSPTQYYGSSSAAVRNHPHYFLKCDESGRPVIYYDDHSEQNVLQPMVQAPLIGQPADAPCENCKNRSAFEDEVLKRLILDPHKIEANNKLLTGLEELEKRRTAQAAETSSWKYAGNCNVMPPAPIVEDRRKYEPQPLPYASPPLSPTFQNPPVFEDDSVSHHQSSDSRSNVHKHTQLLLQLAANSPKFEREAQIVQETRPEYMQERCSPRPADLGLSTPNSDDDDDKYPFGRCYTGSPLLPRDSLDSDTSSNRKSEETGEEETGSLNYLGSIPQPHNGASVLNLQLPVGTNNDRQISIQDTTCDEAIALALLEEANPSLPHAAAVNDSTGQTASDDEVVRRKPTQPGADHDYQIARMMQEDYDEELAQAIHQQEQSQGAEPQPNRQHPQNGARPLSAGSPRRTGTDPAVETFLARQRRREHYEMMQQQQQQQEARQQRQGAAGGDERMLVPQQSLTYEELADLEDVQCGLSTTVINRVCGSFEYRKGLPLLLDPLSEESDQLECCICMNEFCDTNILRQLPCNHVFHRTCIDRWLNGRKTCPVCLKSLI